MSLTRLEEWEDKLQDIFDRIDVHLEEKYDDLYPLHPARPDEGETSNPRHDGLFDVHAAFSAGFGSVHGEGYVLCVRMVTLSRVPKDVREKIEQEVVDLLEEDLPQAFPGKSLSVERDGNVYKIIGDLSLFD